MIIYNWFILDGIIFVMQIELMDIPYALFPGLRLLIYEEFAWRCVSGLWIYPLNSLLAHALFTVNACGTNATYFKTVIHYLNNKEIIDTKS